MQTDVCIRIINEKMNKKFLVRWVFDVPAIIAFGFSSLDENTQNAPQNFSPICLPKPKSFEFLKKSSLWMSVVRACMYVLT